jgi:hypothetical protein
MHRPAIQPAQLWLSRVGRPAITAGALAVALELRQWADDEYPARAVG